MPAFTRSLAEKMLTYAIGRGRRGVSIGWSSATSSTGRPSDEYRLQALIQGIVKSVPFQQRRGERTAPAQEARHP